MRTASHSTSISISPLREFAGGNVLKTVGMIESDGHSFTTNALQFSLLNVQCTCELILYVCSSGVCDCHHTTTSLWRRTYVRSAFAKTSSFVDVAFQVILNSLNFLRRRSFTTGAVFVIWKCRSAFERDCNRDELIYSIFNVNATTYVGIELSLVRVSNDKKDGCSCSRKKHTNRQLLICWCIRYEIWDGDSERLSVCICYALEWRSWCEKWWWRCFICY